MTYDLILGDYAYSSWSLRGWLLFEKFGVPRRTRLLDFFDDRSVAEQMPDFAPARTVPVMKTPDGVVVADSLAMAEELAYRHPEAGFWPVSPTARATARMLAAEMHSGFSALRNECPMNLRTAYVDSAPSDAVLADVARLEVLWDHARATCGGEGPWLCGTYSVADAFYAPVAARLAGYALPLGKAAADYVDAHLADPAFRRWRAMGLVRGETLPWYAKPYETKDWPGPTPLAAHSVASGPSVNDACPYSGKPVRDFLEFQGKVYGFCNPFCRDKTVADPEAWPAFMALVNTH
ncbi:glutathione S-transferase [Shimia biformata]|uniref:glutathione S-transferase n=1 Tax=Shimia biformata TaxID=1294299 RepID=UPI00194EBA7E|nr:glutathione S-transferase [Shimia biformata]